MTINQTNKLYLMIASAIVKKQAEIIGINLATKKARRIDDILVYDDGTVSRLSSNPCDSIGKLVREYMTLSGSAAVKFSQEAIQFLIKEYPDISLPLELRMVS